MICCRFAANADQAVTCTLMLMQHSSLPVDLAGFDATTRLVEDHSLLDDVACGSLPLLKGYCIVNLTD